LVSSVAAAKIVMSNNGNQKTALNIVMVSYFRQRAFNCLILVQGAMTFGKEGTSGARVHDVKDIGVILDAFQRHGHWEIDAARVYAGGTNEEYLAAVGWKERGLMVDTKLYPNKVPLFAVFTRMRASFSTTHGREHHSRN
jgi:hypothetical protein